MNWIDHHRERSLLKSYRAGYDYAMGELLNNEDSVEKLEAEASGPDRSVFDFGMLDAIRAYVGKERAS